MSGFQIPPPNNHQQFEHLLADLLNEHYRTITFKCFGKNGHQQKGIDVLSIERQLIVQCKFKDLTRSAVKLKQEIFADIEDTLARLVTNQVTFTYNTLIIASTVSEHPDFDEYCEEVKKEKGITFQILFWGWETIQNKLSGSPKTLAVHYPHYQFKAPIIEDANLYRITMKKRIQEDFGDWINYTPENRKRRSRMIIHDIKDTDYPLHKNEDGPWFWYAAEIARLSTKGLGFFMDGRNIYVNSKNQWTDVKPTGEDADLYTVLPVSTISVVDFIDIIDYDLRGDEHYLCPHFYLRFNEFDTPFSEVYYQKTPNAKGFSLFYDNSTKL